MSTTILNANLAPLSRAPLISAWCILTQPASVGLLQILISYWHLALSDLASEELSMQYWRVNLTLITFIIMFCCFNYLVLDGKTILAPPLPLHNCP